MKNSKLIFSVLFLSLFVTTFSYAQDWANLNRFKEENAKLALPLSGEKRVVFMGNSITEGWGTTAPEFFTNKPYVNRGISGQTTPQMLLRFKADVINLKPKVVIILAGINDIAGNTGPSTLEMIEDNIISMAQLAKANGIKVILCSVLPAFDFPWKAGMEPAEKVVALNSLIKSFAAKNKMIYVDYYSAMVDERKGLKANLSGDGVHPNNAGYAIMAPLAEKAIKRALGRKYHDHRTK
jgi:lysophospholipase L1-like esterase